MSNYIPADLRKQVEEDYLAYSMSVLIGRAIPDIHDGCKPAARRVLTAMKWLGLKPDGRYMKSARVEGEVMGKLHPHGSAYGTIVTLAAPWNNNVPLVDGQGNWGSSTDGAASSRYTEARLSRFAWDVMLDNADTWDTVANYDGSLQEPRVLDVKVPTVLLNGQEGIGVGYATKLAQHNLRDICDAVVKGTTLYPDFCTGCDIVRDEGLESYVSTGVGTLRLRAKHEVNEVQRARGKANQVITWTCLPPTTNPEKIGQQVKQALDKGQLDGISELRDDSDLTGDRLTITAKPTVDVARLVEALYLHTDLESSYPGRNLVIHGSKPVTLSGGQIVETWKTWRLDRLRVQFEHERGLKASRLEVVQGLIRATDMIDKVVAAIRKADSVTAARVALVSKPFAFTRSQAEAILEMRLRALTGLDAEALAAECGELELRLQVLDQLITSEATRSKHMLAEVKAIGVRHGEVRRSALIEVAARVREAKGPAAPRVAKPRFWKVDKKRSVVEQARGPRGALVIEPTDKVIAITESGLLRKLPANFKGAIGSAFEPTMLVNVGSTVVTNQYVIVFEHDNQLRAMCVHGEDLLRTTSKGKLLVPANSKLLHVGTSACTVEYKSKRKKATTIDSKSAKRCKPGSRGVKVANVEDVANVK